MAKYFRYIDKIILITAKSQKGSLQLKGCLQPSNIAHRWHFLFLSYKKNPAVRIAKINPSFNHFKAIKQYFVGDGISNDKSSG